MVFSGFLHHDITEILLKVALNTITLTLHLESVSRVEAVCKCGDLHRAYERGFSRYIGPGPESQEEACESLSHRRFILIYLENNYVKFTFQEYPIGKHRVNQLLF